MAIDGVYDITAETPLGEQSVKLTLKTNGDSLSGLVESVMGSSEFDGGKVNGDHVTLQMTISSPVGEIDLEYTGTVTGDDIAGEVKAGNFGTWPFKGKRV